MNKKQALLNAAEPKVRTGGYSHFSFRELADEIGIKSASVHYHFPTKADLGAELANQYTERFMAALGDPEQHSKATKHPISRYVELFRRALINDQKMCLCGLLGAEIDGLPDKVRVATRRFFERNLQWLTQAYASLECDEETAKIKALKTLSLLEGAMLVSKAVSDNSVFETVVADLTR